MSVLSCSSGDFALLSAAILGAGKSLRFQATGASMQPLLRDGDTLTVVPVQPRDVRNGDVLLFTSNQDRALAHRVIRKHNDHGALGFTMRGDQALEPDGRIRGSQVLGRVIEIERDGVTIHMNTLSMRVLGILVVIRGRGRLSRRQWSRLAHALMRTMPALYRHLI